REGDGATFCRRDTQPVGEVGDCDSADLGIQSRARGGIRRGKTKELLRIDLGQNLGGHEASPGQIGSATRTYSSLSVYIRQNFTQMIHERFCSNCQSAATTSLRPEGSLLGRSTDCFKYVLPLTRLRAPVSRRGSAISPHTVIHNVDKKLVI